MITKRALPVSILAISVSGLLLLGSGCAGWFSNNKRATESEPFAPGASGESSDLIFVRTGDRRYYYVIDKKRRACFFHAPMYGKKHMAEMDCRKLPEFEELAGPDPRQPPAVAHRTPRQPERQPDHEHHTDRRPAPAYPDTPRAQPPTAAAPSEPPHAAGEALSNEVRERFRRAYVQHFCARRGGVDEPLEVILSRHRLSSEQWTAAKAEFSGDRALWEALTVEAIEACP